MSATAQLSPLDSAFLYLERPAQPLHVGCVALLERSLPFDALVEALAARLGELPRYRQRPVRPVLDWRWPAWEDVPHFDFRRHVHRVAVPAPGGEAELRAVVDTLFATALDQGGPLWETHLIEGMADGRAALLTKVHHCMIDGISGARVLELMADPVPVSDAAASRPVLHAAVTPAPAGTPGLVAAATERLWGSARMALEVGKVLASFVREPASVLPFNGPLSGTRSIVWTGLPMDEVLAIRGATGCKVNDVVLAIVTGALRRYLEGSGEQVDWLRVRTMVPVSMRPPEDRPSLGNLVSAMFPLLPVEVADPRERLARIAREMTALKERGQARASGLVLGIAGAIPAPAAALLARLLAVQGLLNTICTNVPGPREMRRMLGVRILDVHPIVPLFQGLGLEFAIMSYGGRLSITAAVDPVLVPDAERIATALQEAHAELRAAAGIGPAVAAAPGRPALEAAAPAVGDLMSREVLTLLPHHSLSFASKLMRQARIRHLPVVDGAGHVLGLVTHRDLLGASTSSLGADEPERQQFLMGIRVEEVMETHLSLAQAAEPAALAGERMLRGKIGCLPVVNATGRLEGIITGEDFVRWATSHMAVARAA